MAISAGSQSHFEEALRECFLAAKETGCRTINKGKILLMSKSFSDSSRLHSERVWGHQQRSKRRRYGNILAHRKHSSRREVSPKERKQVRTIPNKKSFFSSGQMNGSAGRRVNVMGTACPAQLRGNLIALHLLSSRRPPL